VKQIIKNTVKRTAPRLAHELRRLQRIEDKVDQLDSKLEALHNQPTHDNRLDILRQLAKDVEPYQPPYGITGIFDNPARDSLDRARVIERYLQNPAGQRMLDIGSSLGYMCYYFADRGAVTEGWDGRVVNTEFSRMVGEINGIETTIKTKLFDADTVKTIRSGEYDAVLLLSVVHHILHYNGLEYTQKLMKDLLERTPLLIVELAKRGEDKKLFWNAAQPEDELAIFDLIKDDIVIEKLGDFSNHLSKHTRPMYAIRSKQSIVVNGHQYRYQHKSQFAYSDSPMVYSASLRRYYFGKDFIIKEYDFGTDGDKENQRQIMNDLHKLLHWPKVYGIPQLIEYEIAPKFARMVLKRIPGELLLDRIIAQQSIDAVAVAQQVLRTLHDLQKVNLYHNDIRTWNIIASKKKFSVIDYGLSAPVASDDDIVSLLWVLHAIATGEREGYGHNKALPPEKAFEQPELKKLYQSVKEGERSADTLLKLL
jgi:O-antigen chain-terminating methyltransferase